MNKTASLKQQWWLMLIVLAAGLVNYYLFRPDIALFRMLHLHPAAVQLENAALRLFFTAYFSDIAWCIALCLAAEMLSRMGLLYVWGKLLILCVPFLLEAAQFCKLIPGTFDWTDIGIYALITLVTCYRIFKIPRHEKS